MDEQSWKSVQVDLSWGLRWCYHLTVLTPKPHEQAPLKSQAREGLNSSHGCWLPGLPRWPPTPSRLGGLGGAQHRAETTVDNGTPRGRPGLSTLTWRVPRRGTPAARRGRARRRRTTTTTMQRCYGGAVEREALTMPWRPGASSGVPSMRWMDPCRYEYCPIFLALDEPTSPGNTHTLDPHEQGAALPGTSQGSSTKQPEIQGLHREGRAERDDGRKRATGEHWPPRH
ncbi:hypothetical protein G7046_g7976 [Stylonectria norvegica]|nr:hypothetical protein G7046_g7976 [Stylonectria norvegica]